MKIKINIENLGRIVECEENESIMSALISNKIAVNAVCGGRGTCGQCKIRILDGIHKGDKLSCQIYPTEDISIRFDMYSEEEFEVISNFVKEIEKEEIVQEEKEQEEMKKSAKESMRYSESKWKGGQNSKKKKSIVMVQAVTYMMAIDIGTTTIAMELTQSSTGNVVDTYSMLNHQRVFGADVVSRIQAGSEGKSEALQKCIKDDLVGGITTLIQNNKGKTPSRIVIAGNTTMIHLLMGYSCETLGSFPFTPVNIEKIDTDCRELFGNDSARTAHLGKTPVTIMPGISTYVGGDIVSGLLACDFAKEEQVSILIDLGTNGEMAIGNKDKIIVTSTAAGPAFEGGNISCGVGSIPGAICGIDLGNETVTYQTIGGADAIGLCGTGAIELLAELIKHSKVDETGLLEESFFEKGYPVAKKNDGKPILFTQKDIRELQLAKAAIKAGVEILIDRYGIEDKKINKVYLAGGFGYRMDRQKAVSIGMFPKELETKIQAVGNSSLNGAMIYARNPEAFETVGRLMDVSEEINLSNDEEFHNRYMDSLQF